jgi:tetratricopeptide (TPR) repeat protein/TolB-like protein
MSSIIEGYNYDIFISYRQKDNKGDRWVSEFVEALKTELESTFKEEISVYFDVNPHDGLLETHDVDASLKGKLKCLVFIPIISRTYCDPKSYAWEHEFKAFVKQASHDHFGLKVKLPNGNIASRVLPVRIHVLDAEDIKECESLLSGVMRGVEFIYKEPGVNKPLTADDDEKKNLNNTKYRIQVNKVVNAIKEIISGLQTEPAEPDKETNHLKEPSWEGRIEKKMNVQGKPPKSYKVRWLYISIVAVLLIIAAILAYPKLFKSDTLERLRSSGERISVAVMPFQNMTNDTIWDVWQDGIKDILVTFLSSSEELRIRDPESVRGIIENDGLSDYASITPSAARTISQKLDADVYLYGNIKMAGKTFRLYAQLIDSKSAEVFKSFQVTGTSDEEKIFGLVDSLSVAIRDFLVIQKLQRGHSPESHKVVNTYSPEAYRYFMQGEDLFSDRDYASALKLFSQAYYIDSNMIISVVYMSLSYGNQGLYVQAKELCLKAYQKKEFLPLRTKLYTEWLYANYFETPREEIICLKKLIEVDDNSARAHYILGNCYLDLQQYENAIQEYVKALEIRQRYGLKAIWVYNYTSLGEAYHKTGRYREEKKIYQKADLEFPEDPALLYREAILSLSAGKTGAANIIIEKYVAIQKARSVPESRILSYLAGIYHEAGISDRAEEYYRKALSLDPDNAARMNGLALILIDTGRDINEALGLIEKALELSPDNYSYLDTKGWGLYKQGKYKEALELLEKSWNLKPVYNHEIFLHLEEVKKVFLRAKE